MDTSSLVVFLALGTILAVAVFGYSSAVATQKRMDSDKRKSTLAADSPSTLPPGEKPVDT